MSARHGMWGSPTYKAWHNARQRCTNPNSRSFEDYGARGIRMCDRWDDFALFYADMGACPVGLTLERVNNDKGYEPGNCVWATWPQQMANRRVNGNSTTRFRGVSPYKGGFRASITRNGLTRQKLVRSFGEAVAIRQQWEKEHAAP